MIFSRILVKLIDQAIIPAIVLLTARLASVVLISKVYGIPVAMGGSGLIFENHADYLFVNTYSVFAMMVVMFIALYYTLLRAFILHDTHIHPGLTARLFSLNLSTFIQGSFDLYSKGAVWLSYAYLMTIVVGIMAAFNAVFSWVAYTSLIFTLLGTVLLIIDVENEIMGKKTDANIELDITDRDLLESGGNG